jgi:hypothetical protein
MLRSSPRNVPFNSCVKAIYEGQGAPLVCGGVEVPRTLVVTCGLPALFSPEDPWKPALREMRLSWQRNENGLYTLRREIVTDIPSTQILATYLGPNEKHGCDEELYQRGDPFFEAAGEGFVFGAGLFAAKRSCVNRWKGGRSAVCSAEFELTVRQRYDVSFSQTFDQCVKDRQDPWIRITKAGDPQTGRNTLENKCAGVTVDALPLVVGLFAGGVPAVAVAVTQPFKGDVSGNLGADVLQNKDFTRSSESLAVCPRSVTTTTADGNKTLRIRVAEESIPNLPAPVICRLFKQQQRAILIRAESSVRTPTVTVAKGEGLWSLAERLWGDGRLNVLLTETNSIRGDRPLRVGQVLQVPAIREALNDPRRVWEEDSLWLMSNRLTGSTKGHRALHRTLRPGSPSPDRIYPFSRLTEAQPPR